jgi:cardiolipin synthase
VTNRYTVDGNTLTVLTRGEERLSGLIALIDGAQTSLRLLYYIFAHDAAGHRVRDAMIDAANRGVAVKLVLDGFGSDTTGQDDFLKPLKQAGPPEDGARRRTTRVDRRFQHCRRVFCGF